MVRGARERDVDLVIIVGGQMVFENRHLENRKFVYELAKPDDFDGVVFLGTSLSSHEGHAAIAPLIIRFAKLPTVSIGLDIGKGSTVLVDNAQGTEKITEHFIEVHHCKNFAYIAGPQNNGEARTRLKAFKDTLSSHHLTINANHIVEGAFTEASGEAAIKELLDDRGVDIDELDAILAANDSMAVGAMDELKRRGFDIPNDIAIGGFDDIEPARYADTPLSTIQQPLIMQGRAAIEKVLDFAGEKPETVNVNPKLVVRRSCGCGTVVETPTLSTSPPTMADSLENIVIRKRPRIERDLITVAERGGIERGFEKELMSAVVDAISGRGYVEVTRIVSRLVSKSIETGEGVHVWAAVIAALDKHLSMLVNAGTDASARIEAILHRARLAMSEAVEHFHSTKVRALRNQTMTFNEAAIGMLTTLNAGALRDSAAQHLPKLGIDTCSIALFDRLNYDTRLLRRFLVMENGQRIDNYDTFDATEIIAPDICRDKPHIVVIEPLCFYEEIFGVAALAYGPDEGAVYEQLGAFFSASIKALVMSEAEMRGASENTDADVHIDRLTGAYNRNHLKVRFAEEIARAQDTRLPLSLLLIDMDDFGKLNSDLGEDQGDQALIGVADTIKRVVKPTEILVRLEDDEFVLLLPNMTADDAKKKADLINRRLKLALAFTYHGHISASFGVETTSPPHDTDEKTMLAAAKRALAKAKRAGKDRVIHVRDMDLSLMT